VPTASTKCERGHPTRKKGGTEIVYELYGLTDEEIEIVEDAVGGD